MVKKTLVVGNCNYDGPRLVHLIESNFKAKAEEAKTIKKAIKLIKSKKYDLIIVNRIIDGDRQPGLELVDYIKTKKIKTPIMLITNYKNKMSEAIKHGAIKGFSKAKLNDLGTIRLLKKYLK